MTNRIANQISDLQVMQSAAGYYLGRSIVEDFGGSLIPVPYDRQSGYWATHAEAFRALEIKVEGLYSDYGRTGEWTKTDEDGTLTPISDYGL